MKHQVLNLLKTALFFCFYLCFASCNNNISDTLNEEELIKTKQNVNTELYDKYKDLWAHCYYIDNQIYFDGQNTTFQNVDSVKKSEFQDIITRLNNDFISYPPTTLPTTKSTENNGETPKGGVTTIQCGYNQLKF